MVKANEFRIGNLIRYNPNGGFGTIIELHTIGKDTVYGKSLDGQLKNLIIDLDRWNEPILLTPEILEGCWFKKEGLQCDYAHDNMDLSIYDNGYALNYYGSGPIGVPFKYLHQLQNLYFALTGEELEIKSLINGKKENLPA